MPSTDYISDLVGSAPSLLQNGGTGPTTLVGSCVVQYDTELSIIIWFSESKKASHEWWSL